MEISCEDCKHFRIREEWEIGVEDLAFNCCQKNINKNDTRGCVDMEEKDENREL